MATTNRKKSKLQEDLVSLYLRLNGFFVTTGFIVHSPVHGRSRTELDALALRLPFNAEPERQVGPDQLLKLSENTDLMLCEVKSRGQQLRFNGALVDQAGAVATVIRWSGLFPKEEIADLSEAVVRALKATAMSNAEPPTIVGPRGVRIRGALFSPERKSRRANQPWFVTGPETLQYVWKCLCPATPRDSCATTYDLQLWGSHEPIVRYIKSRSTDGPGDMDALYAFVEENGL